MQVIGWNAPKNMAHEDSRQDCAESGLLTPADVLIYIAGEADGIVLSPLRVLQWE